SPPAGNSGRIKSPRAIGRAARNTAVAKRRFIVGNAFWIPNGQNPGRSGGAQWGATGFDRKGDSSLTETAAQTHQSQRANARAERVSGGFRNCRGSGAGEGFHLNGVHGSVALMRNSRNRIIPEGGHEGI